MIGAALFAINMGGMIIMKKGLRKTVAVASALTLCAGLFTGCGAASQVESLQDELADVTEYLEQALADYEEELGGAFEGDTEYEYEDEEYEYEYEDDAEGDTDLRLPQGYYGFWDGDTEYIFGVLSDTDFMINIVGGSSPLLYAEGTMENVGGGDFVATITSTDNDFAEGQVIDITMISDDSIALSSDAADLGDIVAGNYAFAGSSASDIEGLK